MGIKTIKVRTVRARVSNLFAATVMTAGSLVAATPLFLSQPALADSPSVQPCTTVTTVKTTDLSSWDLSQTRANGHNVLTTNGLHVYTDGNTDTGTRTDGVSGTWNTDKAAGYYTTSFPLSGLGNQTIDQALDYTPTSSATPTEPGLQLVVDFDNNGTNDGILVGESVYAGNNWWLSSSTATYQAKAPHTGGGYGSPWYGTPDEWLAQFPDAQVTTIGYSLGSGVHGDGVINKISLGCTDYTFAKPKVVSNKDECKDNKYKEVVDTNGNGFKNQGQCVSYANGRDNDKNKNENAIAKFFNSLF